MPVMDGLAATLAIRALPAPHGAVPILALTADAFPDTRARAAQAGTNDFLAKPVQPADLEQALSRLFSAAAPPARVPGPAATDPATSAWLDLMVPQQVFGSLPPPLHGRLLLHFFSDDSGSLARLLDRLDAADGGTVRQAAHALRGAALNLGLSRLADTLVAIEAAAQPGPMADAGDWRQRVLDELTATHEACLAAGWISATPNDTAAA